MTSIHHPNLLEYLSITNHPYDPSFSKVETSEAPNGFVNIYMLYILPMVSFSTYAIYVWWYNANISDAAEE